MSEERLSSLAVIKIHRDIVVNLDFDKLIVDFANQNPRRMALPCIFFVVFVLDSAPMQKFFINFEGTPGHIAS